MFRLKNLLLLLGSIVFTLLLVEVALHFVHIEFQDVFYEADLNRGWQLRPGFQGFAADENYVAVKINSDGLRDEEHALQKDPNTLRIAVLGDSYMEAMNVPYEKTFAAVLGSELSARLNGSGHKAETINFGVSGFGTGQELITYRLNARKYRPDIVLLAFYSENDVFNNSRPLNPQMDPEQAPYFSLQNGKLVEDDSFRKMLKLSRKAEIVRNIRAFATEHSRLGQLLYMFVTNYRARRAGRNLLENAQKAGVQSMNQLENMIYVPPVNQEMQKAWDVTDALILQLKAEVAADGAELWIATLSNKPQVLPDLDERKRYAAALGQADLLYPDRHVRELAQKNAIPVVTLVEPLAEYAAQNHVYLNGGYNARKPLGKGHWNEKANRLAAEITAREISQKSPRVTALSAQK